jgi:hypothetical protein
MSFGGDPSEISEATRDTTEEETTTDETDNTGGRATLIHVTPGVTLPNFSRDPLATEGEMSEGPADLNPWRSERERRAVERIKREEQAAQDDELYKTGSPEVDTRGPRDSPLLDPPGFWGTDVTADLPGPEFGETTEIPELDPLSYDGPQF